MLLAVFTSSLAFTQLNLTELSHYPYAQSRGDCSDIWGYVDQLGNEYAIVGNQTGTSIVDVTDPANPVEVFYTAGANTIWRDIKVWGTTAYITNEGGNGLKIIDLSNLPGALSAGDVSQYTGSTYPFTTAHNLFIDEVGRAYILGANNGAGGAIILDVATDPLNPVELGRYNDYYIHDAFVRGDTLWGGAIDDGFFVVVDVTNPASCVTMATQLTPTTFSHNCWLSDDGNTLYTTDEVSNAYIGAYDVSDIANISELDRIQSSPGMEVIPHNVFVLGNFLVTSYYRDGVVVHDATNPSNLIEVGNFDTAPSFSGDGFNGCWGVYPYLPSGNVIASDIEEGLYVLGATYTQAAYLEGNVTDNVTTNPINNALVEIVSTTQSDNTNTLGDYATGVATGGTFDVTVSKLGYFPQTISGVVLTNGNTTVLDVQLVPQPTFTLTGQVIDQNSNPIPNAQVMISNAQYNTTVTTNGLGNFTISSFLEDTYDVTIGIWGYHTLCLPGQLLNSNGTPYVYQLDEGYSDYFDLDLGWTISGNASSGDWEQGEPVGTNFLSSESNPDYDSQDCGIQAYITGNAGGTVGNDDVDGGSTTLSSPLFDLSNYTDPFIYFERWFFNDGGSGTPNDSLVITLTNGSQTVTIDAAGFDDPENSTWAVRDIHVSDFLTPTAFMQLKVTAMDINGGHIVEGGFDRFIVHDGPFTGVEELASETNAAVYPVPFQDQLNIRFEEMPEVAVLEVEVVELSSGRVIDNQRFEASNEVSFRNDYAAGLYLLRVYGDGALLVNRKVVKL